jgi:hypothetical protein
VSGGRPRLGSRAHTHPVGEFVERGVGTADLDVPRITPVTMPRVAKPNDRVFFAFCAAAGALILLGSALPTFELYLSAVIGGGDSQRSFDYHRDLHLLTYAEPGGLVFPLSGAALLATGIAGALRPRGWLVVAAAVLTVPVFVQTVKTVDYAKSPEGGVYGCEQPELETCVGYLTPAVRDFRADILRKPEARHPDYLGPGRGDFSIEHLTGWRLVGWSVALFSLVAWFRAMVLVVPKQRYAALLYAGLLVLIAIVVLMWWLRDFEP